MTATPTPTLADVAALGAALRRFYEPEMSHEEVRKHARTGWTAEAFCYVEMLAEWVLEHETGPSLESEGRAANHALRQQIGMAFFTANRLLARAPLAVALRWAAVEAAGLPQADSEAVHLLLFDDIAPPPRDGAASTQDRWLALGEIGPLVYAAGLNVDEATAQMCAGALEAEGLATLAALRGWRLPPSP